MLKKSIRYISKHKKLKNLFIYGFGQVFNLITPLLVMPYIVSVCGEEGLGKVGISLSLMFILIVIVDYGSYIKGVKEVSIHREDRQKLESLFTTIYALKTMLFLLVILLSIVFIYSVTYFEFERPVFLYSLFVIFGQLINPGWFLQGVENFKWISLTNIISKIIYAVAVIFLINQKNDYVYVNFYLGLGAIIGNAFGFFWIIRHYKFQNFTIDPDEVKYYLFTDFKFCISQLFLSLRQYAPILLIGYLSGSFVAGQYRILEQIIHLFRTYLQMFFRFVYSKICFELNKNMIAGISIWKKYNLLNIILVLFLLFILFFSASFVLQYFNIDKLQLIYMESLLKIALIIPLLLSISLPFEQLMFALDKNKSYINITINLTLINILMMYLALDLYELHGAVFSIAVTELIIIIAYYFSLKSSFDKSQQI